MKRVFEFIRSVIPADPFQLLFLAGIVCLLVAHGLRWKPSSLPFSVQPSDNLKQLLWPMSNFILCFIIFSALAGYFVCFWPGKHPVRRTIWSVCTPAFMGLALMFGLILYVSPAPPTSVLENTSSVLGHDLRWAEATLWTLPQGFQFAILGLVLIGIFVSRLAFGISTLPLALPEGSVSQSQGSGPWDRLRILIFVLIGPFFLVGAVLSFVSIGLPFALFSRPPAYVQSVWFGRLATVLENLTAYGLLVCFLWRKEKQTIKQSLRLPDLKSLLLAVGFAIGIDTLISAGQYLSERVQWASQSLGRFGPPRLVAYLNLPDPWLFLMLFAALCEELIFRGLLQPRFVQRYGLHRGIFLVGITWAAYHFFYDFSFLGSARVKVFEKLGFRIFMCVVLSFVLAWLTLRAGSVLPAAVAHGFYNVLNASSLGPLFSGETLVRVGLWAVLAYALFRYWPVKEENSPEGASALPGLENAV